VSLTILRCYVKTFRQINSPVALATFGAFFVPEPLGICLVLAAAIWWLTRIASMVDAGRWAAEKLAELGQPPRDIRIANYLQRCAAFFRSLARPIVVHIMRLEWPDPILTIILKGIRRRTSPTHQSNGKTEHATLNFSWGDSRHGGGTGER
jgi:hypothetical protein